MKNPADDLHPNESTNISLLTKWIPLDLIREKGEGESVVQGIQTYRCISYEIFIVVMIDETIYEGISYESFKADNFPISTPFRLFDVRYPREVRSVYINH